MTNIYVGNLPYDATEEQLRELFGAHGSVERVNLITDRMTGQSRGFGFVEMVDQEAAEAAIEAINGTELNGRTLNVNVARPKTEHRGGGGGGHRGGGYGRE
ncbi:MAG TPA: RNA-binding protein [Phycisphaerae bacterium]|nr:RNA-binding protein [Phycisphaerae bacterium]